MAKQETDERVEHVEVNVECSDTNLFVLKSKLHFFDPLFGLASRTLDSRINRSHPCLHLVCSTCEQESMHERLRCRIQHDMWVINFTTYVY